MYLCGVEIYYLLSRIFWLEFTTYNSNYTSANKPDGIIVVIWENEGKNIWVPLKLSLPLRSCWVKKPHGHSGRALLWCRWDIVFLSFGGTRRLKSYPKHMHLSEVMPFAVSFIPPFVLSYNPNYIHQAHQPSHNWNLILTSFRTFSTSKLSGAADAILYCVEPIFNVFCDENGREIGLETVVNRNR